jgi:senataxin
MDQKTNAKKKEIDGRSLIDLVFSWSLGDVLNKDVYKNQVFCFFLSFQY